ncbi:MAG: TrkA C-terminal domain-containing protein, partial [Anaerolineae bacterium]
VMTFGNGEVSMVSIDAPPHLAGRMVGHIIVPAEIRVVAITREGQAFIPTRGTEFRNGDVIHFVVLASSMERLETMLGMGET